MPFDPEAIRAFEHGRWQRVAAAYGSTFASVTEPFIDPLLDAAEVTSGVRMLDIACGPGFVTSQANEVIRTVDTLTLGKVEDADISTLSAELLHKVAASRLHVQVVGCVRIK